MGAVALIAAGVDDQQDRHVAAQAEEEPPDQVGDVDGREGAHVELGEERAQGEEAAAEEEGNGGDEIEPAQQARLSLLR